MGRGAKRGERGWEREEEEEDLKKGGSVRRLDEKKRQRRTSLSPLSPPEPYPPPLTPTSVPPGWYSEWAHWLENCTPRSTNPRPQRTPQGFQQLRTCCRKPMSSQNTPSYNRASGEGWDRERGREIRAREEKNRKRRGLDHEGKVRKRYGRWEITRTGETEENKGEGGWCVAMRRGRPTCTERMSVVCVWVCACVPVCVRVCGKALVSGSKQGGGEGSRDRAAGKKG